MTNEQELESVVGTCLEEQYKRQVRKDREWVQETLHATDELDDEQLLACVAQEMEEYAELDQEAVMQHILCHAWWRRHRKLPVRDEDAGVTREIEVPPSNRFHEWMQQEFMQ